MSCGLIVRPDIIVDLKIETGRKFIIKMPTIVIPFHYCFERKNSKKKNTEMDVLLTKQSKD